MLSSSYPINKIGQYVMIPVPVSFETNEVGTFALPTLPFRSKVVSAKSAVNKTVAGTDSGTITVKKSSTTIATVTVAASAAIGDEDTAPSVTETVVDTDEQYTLVTAKSTAGGRAILFLTLEVLPSH